MDWTSLIGPAVVAAVVSGPIAVMQIIVSARTARGMHAERLAFDERKFAADRELAERKFEIDKALAERKVAADIALSERKFELDARLVDRKRRQDLAEEVLSGFYQMADIIRAIRSPASYEGEGKDRPKVPGEKEEVGRLRDTYFAIVARFEAHRKEIADLLSRKYRMAAWFGKEAEEPFEIMQQSLNTIIVSARLLVAWAGDNLPATGNAALERKMRGDIWEGAVTPDPISEQLSRSISLIEAICQPVLQERSK